MSTSGGVRPSSLLARLREEILIAAELHHASDVRVFGSVATGADTTASDLDLIVHFSPDASLYDQIALAEDLRDLLGIDVDVISDGAAGIDAFSPVIAV